MWTVKSGKAVINEVAMCPNVAEEDCVPMLVLFSSLAL